MATRRSSPNVMDFPQPLIIKLDQPKVEHKVSTLFKVIWIGLVFVILVTLILWVAFNQPITQSADPDQNVSFPATVIIDFPSLTSLRDPWPVSVTVHNTGNQTMTVYLTIIVEPSKQITLAADGSGTVKIKDIPPGGIFTHTFTFVPLEKPVQGIFTLKASLQESTGTLVSYHHDAWKVKVWGIRGIRFFLDLILKGGGIFAALIAIFWEQLKKGSFGS